MKKLTRPCAKCPFRIDCLEGWLGRDRMQQICNDTVTGNDYFTCHETSGELDYKRRALCAGKLILEERVNYLGNSSTRMAMAFGYTFKNYKGLKGKELIFNSVEEVVKHHTKTSLTTKILKNE